MRWLGGLEMIHYHGTPITPNTACAKVLRSRHAFVSYLHNSQLDIVIEQCQSFAVDNGAFSAWKSGKVIDWSLYYQWVDKIKNLPNFDFAVIPDVIDGDEIANDDLIKDCPIDYKYMSPVWHMHESIERFYDLCHRFSRVCIGSSGEFATVGNKQWWARINLAISEVLDDYGQPITKLHGLRMLNPNVFTRLPLSSADSTNIGQNIGIDKAWNGNYTPPDKDWRAIIMAERIEQVTSDCNWKPNIQQDLFL